ncbi:MAG: uroporphyrinogen-III synthase [Proteobacteria bacterium]|nr:uroporphyrinogen-III synthase [Pseudomonadota bacterium]
MNSLQGRIIALTRPVGQNRPLQSAIEKLGGRAALFPLLETKPVANPQEIVQWECSITRYAWLIFVSANAVRYVWPYIAPHLGIIRARFACIGPATAAALLEAGVSQVVFPESRFDSEGLLERLLAEGVEGQQITLVRGSHGREVLGDTLARHGARVTRLAVYERVPGYSAARELIGAVHKRQCDVICLSSSEAIGVLKDVAGEKDALWHTPVFVSHQRIMERACLTGFKEVHCTASGDKGLLEGLVSWEGRAL